MAAAPAVILDEETMRGIELRQLRYFAILAQELHFRKAAELAFITQPALSQQISKLEEIVGVTLFQRDGRTVALTPAGVMLQQETAKMFDQLQRALRLTREAPASASSGSRSAWSNTPICRSSRRRWCACRRPIPA